HHDTPDGIVSLQLRKGPLELIEDLRADRVQSIGSIDRDRRDMGLRIARDYAGLAIHPTTSLLVPIESLAALRPAVPARYHRLRELGGLHARLPRQCAADATNP